MNVPVSKRALIQKHGSPKSVTLQEDVGAYLEQFGLRYTVHPRDAIAFIYPDWSAAEDYSTASLEKGVHYLGIFPLDDGTFVGIVDLRRRIADITDPALPDDWRPPNA